MATLVAIAYPGEPDRAAVAAKDLERFDNGLTRLPTRGPSSAPVAPFPGAQFFLCFFCFLCEG